MKPGEVKIFNALVNHEGGLSFTELKEKTGLSHTALSNYLREMQQTGFIRKDYEAKKYLLPNIYLPMADFANAWQKMMKVSAANFVSLGLKIRKIKMRDKRIAAMKKFLEVSFHSLTLFLWKIIGEATAEYGSDARNLKDQQLAVRRSKIINQAVENWIVAISDSLAAAMVINIDVLDDAGEQVFKRVLAQATEKVTELKNFIPLE